MTIVDKNYGWKSAPQDPEVVYIAIPVLEPYRDYIEKALVSVVRSHGLKPVVVENVSMYDLKGRIVITDFPVIGRSDWMLSKERYVSGILYYSYAGDAKSAVETIENGLVFSEGEISNSANKLCQTSKERLLSMRIVNQSCAVAYWWNMKAKVGMLSGGDPYKLIANEIASQLDQFLRSA
ncbi:hypothetical protein E3E36_08635 [Thermococcus sp. M36]|uniref:hypothetical protein n=1 Tax=Thermococcus sp. M36 TaxID=1638261 RepID=UPI001438E748|nr:hypothetical protein [Thermococcus sp. M36]NJE06205.1 hypothetical protein [Thermococcus sp. M36]